MKQIAINNYLIVECGEGLTDVSYDSHRNQLSGNMPHPTNGDKEVDCFTPLPSGQWEIIGRCDSLEESEYEPLIEKAPTGLTIFKEAYRNYTYADNDGFSGNPFFMPSDSFYTLMEAHSLISHNCYLLKKVN